MTFSPALPGLGTKLIVDRNAYDKIMEYIIQCPVEINGFGYLTRLDRSTLVLNSPDDVFITHQEVTIGSAHVDASVLGLAIENAAAAGRSQDLRLQWHSHVDMAASFSITDRMTIDSYGHTGSQWMVSMVLNKHGEFSTRLDLFSPFRCTIELQVVVRSASVQFEDQCRRDIAEMVKQKDIKDMRLADAAASYFTEDIIGFKSLLKGDARKTFREKLGGIIDPSKDGVYRDI